MNINDLVYDYFANPITDAMCDECELSGTCHGTCAIYDNTMDMISDMITNNISRKEFFRALSKLRKIDTRLITVCNMYLDGVNIFGENNSIFSSAYFEKCPESGYETVKICWENYPTFIEAFVDTKTQCVEWGIFFDDFYGLAYWDVSKDSSVYYSDYSEWERKALNDTSESHIPSTEFDKAVESILELIRNFDVDCDALSKQPEQRLVMKRPSIITELTKEDLYCEISESLTEFDELLKENKFSDAYACIDRFYQLLVAVQDLLADDMSYEVDGICFDGT